MRFLDFQDPISPSDPSITIGRGASFQCHEEARCTEPTSRFAGPTSSNSMLVALHKRVNDKLTFRLRKCPRISATLPGTQRVTRTVVDSGPTVTEGSIVIIFAESVRWA